MTVAEPPLAVRPLVPLTMTILPSLSLVIPAKPVLPATALRPMPPLVTLAWLSIEAVPVPLVVASRPLPPVVMVAPLRT